jgi:hypothetical protein
VGDRGAAGMGDFCAVRGRFRTGCLGVPWDFAQTFDRVTFF